LSNNQRGILALVACMSSYTVNDVLVKQILQHYPAGETIFVRGGMSAALLCAAAIASGHRREIGSALSPALTLRAICDGLSTVGFIVALAHMHLANIAALLQIAPLLLIVVSIVLYREAVGWRSWSAIGAGFVGTLLVIKPVPSAFDIWALVGAASALAAALRELLTHRIGFRYPAIVVAFWAAIGITLLGAPFAAVEDWRMFAAADLTQLFIAAMFVGLATYLLAVAFRNVDLSVVAPFRYSYTLTSGIGGFLVFGELPDRLTVLGAILIVGGGIYALHREAIRRRQLSATIVPAA
jgi:drug/metabolite transporter (DMT)-like permease